MAIVTSMTKRFKRDCFMLIHNMQNGGHILKLALYTSAAVLDDTSETYVLGANFECTATGNYTQGGKDLVYVASPTQPQMFGSAATVNFDALVWANSTITANGCAIYNPSASNLIIATMAFGGDKSSTAGNFTINFPTAGATTSVIRIV